MCIDNHFKSVISAYYNLQTFLNGHIKDPCVNENTKKCYCISKSEVISAGCAMICAVEEEPNLECAKDHGPYYGLIDELQRKFMKNVDCGFGHERKKLITDFDVRFSDNHECTLCQLYTIMALQLSQQEIECNYREGAVLEERWLFSLGFLSVVNRLFAEKYYVSLLKMMASLTQEHLRRELADYICKLVKRIYECYDIVTKNVSKKYMLELINRASKGVSNQANIKTINLAQYAFRQMREVSLLLEEKQGHVSEVVKAFKEIKQISESENAQEEFLAWYDNTKGRIADISIN